MWSHQLYRGLYSFSPLLRAHFHRRCETQFLNNHLYQYRVLWWLYFYQVKYKPINNKPIPAWLFIYPIFPLKGAVTSTRTLSLFLLDFLGAPQNWGRGVLRPPPPLPVLLHFLTAYSIVMKLGTHISSHKRNKMMRKLFHNGSHFLMMSSENLECTPILIKTPITCETNIKRVTNDFLSFVSLNITI